MVDLQRMFFARICRHVTVGRFLTQRLVSRLTEHGFWRGRRGCGIVNNGILVIVATKIDGSMLQWPICSKFAQSCCKFLNRFQKLATRCSTANIAQKASATECYTRTIFRAISYRCKSMRFFMRFLMRFQSAPYPTLHECCFSRSIAWIEKKIITLFEDTLLSNFY